MLLCLLPLRDLYCFNCTVRAGEIWILYVGELLGNIKLLQCSTLPFFKDHYIKKEAERVFNQMSVFLEVMLLSQNNFC